MEKTCNGWTNYATWRVNLEMFDGSDMSEYYSEAFEAEDTCALSQHLKDYANETIEMDAKEGLALDYARAFISNVNWYEIAQHMLEDYQAELAA
jgi:hypothetical protein